MHTLTAGEQFTEKASAVLAFLLLNEIITDAEYEEFADRVRNSLMKKTNGVH